MHRRFRTGLLQRGFTLVELVAVIVVMAIIAVSISANFDRKVYDARLATDQIRSTVSYAQRLAISTRRVVTVNVASSTVTLDLCQQWIASTASACPAVSSSITLPNGQTSVTLSNASLKLGTSTGATSFKYSAQGAETPDIVINVGEMSGGSLVARGSVTVSSDTGYVR